MAKIGFEATGERWTVMAAVSAHVAFVGLLVSIAAALFQYAMWSILGVDVPWYADLAGGVATNACVVPVAVVCWVLRMAGVHVPFIH